MELPERKEKPRVLAKALPMKDEMAMRLKGWGTPA